MGSAIVVLIVGTVHGKFEGVGDDERTGGILRTTRISSRTNMSTGKRKIGENLLVICQRKVGWGEANVEGSAVDWRVLLLCRSNNN
jgi:hypothetical protein